MRIKDTKRTFFMYLPYECTAVEEYLEQMAEKGWLLQSVKGNFFKFKRIKLQKIKYSVDVLHKVSTFDHKDSELALEYREYCEAAGWNYVCQSGKIQIFYTDINKETTPIHTDEDEKFKAVFRASLPSITSQLLLILISLLNLNLQLFKGSTEFTLSTNLGILSAVSLISFIFIITIGVINFFLWGIKARGNLKENKFMPYNNYKQLNRKNIFKKVYMIVVFIMLLRFTVFDNYVDKGFSLSLIMIMCVPIIIMISTKKFINKKRYSKNINMAITVGSTLASIFLVITLIGHAVFSSITDIGQSKMPTEKANLTLIDFGYSNDANPYVSYDKSILAQKIEYSFSDKSTDSYLSYTVFQSRYPWVIKFDENRLVNRLNRYGIDLKGKNTNLSSSIKVYSDSEKRSYVLVSDDKVVDITKSFSDISEEEFLNKVYNKLFKQ